MKIELVKALIERGVINKSTCIVADCPVLAMGGMPAEMELPLVVDRIHVDNGVLTIYARNKHGHKYNVDINKIKSIDGMDPLRLGAAYNIKPNGNSGLVGKKRGRKPKLNTVRAQTALTL
jgi:hypothetical protein